MKELVKNYTADGAIPAKSIVSPSATPDGKGFLQVAKATAPTSPLLGVSAEPADVADGGRIDVQHDKIAEAVTGGAVSAGEYVTTDDKGRAVSRDACISGLDLATGSVPGIPIDIFHVGMALSAANASGLGIDIMICPGVSTLMVEAGEE